MAFVLCITGCSHSTNINPLNPPDNDKNNPTQDTQGIFPPLSDSAPGHYLAGMFSLDIDLASGNINAVPLREAGMHYNATTILIPPNCNDCVTFQVTKHQPAINRLKVNVFIKNPTPITVYDVRGIFMTDQPGWKLLNNWGYTPLYDDTPPISLNPFISFHWGYFWQATYDFWPGSLRVQEYEIEYPENPDWNGLHFAVDVSWPGLCEEPYQLTLEGPGSVSAQGGVYEIRATTFDHQNDPTSVVVDASPMGAGLINLSITSEDHYGKNVFTHEWHGELHFPGIGSGPSPGAYELVAAAYSGMSVPIFQNIRIEVSPVSGLVEVTPPWLNIYPRYLEVKDNLLFIGDYHKIIVEDYTDPANPVFLGALNLEDTGLENWGMIVGDNVLIIDGTWNFQWKVYDDKFGVVYISDPTDLKLSAIVDLPDEPHGIYDLYLNDGYLMTTVRYSKKAVLVNTVDVYDVDPPELSHLTFQEQLPAASTYPAYSKFQDDELFIFLYGGRMLGYHFDPFTGLTLAADIQAAKPHNSYYDSTIIQGGYLYLAIDTVIYVYDIDPIEECHYVNSLDLGSLIVFTTDYPGWIYAAVSYRLVPISLENPEAPQPYEAPGQDLCDTLLATTGTRIYTYSGSGGYTLQIIDLTNPQAPVFFTTPVQYIYYDSFRLFGNKFVFRSYESNILAFDATDPSALQIIGTSRKIYQPEAVVAKGPVGYVIESNSKELKIVDVSDPSQANVVGVSPNPNSTGSSIHMAFWHGYLALTRQDGLTFYDISDPFSPVVCGGPYDKIFDDYVEFQGDLGLAYGHALRPFKVHSPQDVELLWTASGGILGNKSFPGGHIYKDLILGTFYGDNPDVPDVSRLRVYKIFGEFPGNPVKSIDLGTEACSLAVNGDFAYVYKSQYYDWDNEIRIFDIDPWENTHLYGVHSTSKPVIRLISLGPLLIAFYPDAWEAFDPDSNGNLVSVAYQDVTEGNSGFDAASDNGYFYYCNTDAGLHIYKLE